MAIVTNATGANTVQVFSDGAMVVRTTDIPADAGFIISAGEVAHANVVSRLVRSQDLSPDYRLRVGTDSLMWNDNFNHAQLNTYKYQLVSSTATVTMSGGFIILNGGSSVASGAVARVQTYKSFPLFGSFPLYVEFWSQYSQVLQTNNVMEFGLGYATGTSAPTDGIFFRLNGSGSFQGVINNNGSETTTGDILNYIPEPGQTYHYLIVIHNDTVEFWVDDTLVGKIQVPSTSTGPTLNKALPLLLRNYNSAATSLAQQLKVSVITISLGDLNNNRLWATTMAAMGQSSIANTDGQVVGFTTAWANAVAPTALTLSTTALTAGYGSLGGQWSFAAFAGSEVDNIAFGYLVPAGTAALPGKSLIIRGIRIDAINTGAAVATTPTAIQWGISVGSTALATSTADSTTAGTRAGRRLLLGMQSFVVGAAIGAMANTIDINLDAPITVEPGTYFILYYKQFLGTATASQIIRGTCMINGYWE